MGKQKSYHLLNKIVMFTAEAYIELSTAEGNLAPEALERLRYGIIGQRKINMFTQTEAKICLELGKDERLIKIMDNEISFIVFVYELMKIWTMTVPRDKRPILGVSDKHFKLGGSVFYKQMLVAKQKDTKEYEEKQAIINDSKRVAQEFFQFHWEQFKLNEV